MGKFASIRFRRNVIEESDVENASHVDGPCTTTTTTTMRARWRHPLVVCAVRNRGYIFFACVFLLFMHTGYLAGHSEEHGVGQQGRGELTEHPITKLMDEAEEKYRQKLEGQSRTLKAAVGEYRRRYKRAPPRGFEEWWEFAQENGAMFVDEYDGLVADLAPFWQLQGPELRRRVQQVSELPSIDVVRIKDGVASTLRLNSFEDSEVSARANGFRDMILSFAHKLPDLDFPINAKAEGRVLVPWEHRMYPNLTHQDSSVGIETMLNGPFRPDWGTDGTVWEAWRRTCAPVDPARRLFSSLRNVFTTQLKNYLSDSPSAPDLHFASTTAASTLDFCAYPHEHYTQGHFFSDWRTLPVLYPVFSPARARGFMDIRIPSHYYYGSTDKYTYGWDPINLELDEVDKMEVPWAQKENKIFWRGATTGGGSHPPGFAPQYQRHRFLRMASDNSSAPQPITFISSVPGSPSQEQLLTTTTLPVSVLNAAIMDTAFTKAVSPESYPGGLPALTASHRFDDAVPLGRHWAFKYLVDMDGMGYSGRFMAFLASDSVPLKATVYEEYFSDWIQPWLHFVPLSHTYKEIYDVHAYFSGPPRAALDVLRASQSANANANASESAAAGAGAGTGVGTGAGKGADAGKGAGTEGEGNDDDDDEVWRFAAAEGDRRLRRIARAGKEWKKRVGRTVDMEVYVYRLALEWARLCADDRDVMGFEF